jgi:hypothetical protein
MDNNSHLPPAAPATADCLSQAAWLDLLSDRALPDWQETHAEAAEHLVACGHCQAQVSEVRRFQTLILRGRAPGLTPEQRQSLDERVRLLSTQLPAEERQTSRWVWAGALAAAALLAAVLAQPWWPSDQEPTFADRIVAATVPTADKPGAGVATGAVEGGVQVTDRDGHWRPLRAGDVLRTGQRLQSLQQGRLVIPGRFELQVSEGSEVELLAMSDQMALLRLRRGGVDCTVDKLRPGQRFAVLFGAHRAAVVGTQFSVRQGGDGDEASVEVREGAVRVDAADDALAPPAETTTMVRPGQRWRFGRGVMSLESMATPPVAPVVAAPVVPVPQAPVAEVPAVATPVAVRTVQPRPNKVKAAKPQKQFLIEVPAQGHAVPNVRSPRHPTGE